MSDTRVRTSTQTEAFDEAFAKAQAKFEAAVKSNTNPAFRSKYADVSSIIDATLEHLNSEGIGVKQHPGFAYLPSGDGVEAFMVVTTRLTFKGQWEESEIAIPAVQRDKFDAQSCGSALTYACRYALQGIFVVRREDDDANAATGRGSSEAAKAVGEAKVAALKEKAGKSPANGQQGVISTLFYLEPPEQNGHYVEFVNIQHYLASHPEDEDSVRMVLTAHKAKKTKDNTALVPSGELQPLLEKLAGEMAITVKRLEAK